MTQFATFKDAFGALQTNAKKLREQSEPNIDELLPIVQESMDAFKVCKERIAAVELALQAALNHSQDGPGDQVGAPDRP